MIRLKDISKFYTAQDETVEALQEVSLEIQDGEFVVIIGPSGSGKSTLLHLIGGLDIPTYGQIEVNGKILNELKDKALSRYRNQEIGFIFQDFYLAPHLTILENIQMPLAFSQRKKWREENAEKKAKELLTLLHLQDRLHHKPTQISGGQKQRVAIARALINKPKILLADEPTGNLDSLTGKKIISMLKRIHQSQPITMIVVTHDPEIAKYADRTIKIKDGTIIMDQKSTS